MLRFPKQSGAPRVVPVEPPYDDETAAALALLGAPIALFRVFARRPERAHGIHGWGRYYLSRQSALDLRHRELVIDRTTVRCGAEYEWGVHVARFAGKAGFDAAQIRSIVAGGPEDGCWTDPADRAVLRAVDSLCATDDLSDDRWRELTDAIGQEATVDLLLLCGWYHAISFTARVLRLQPEPGTPAFRDHLTSPLPRRPPMHLRKATAADIPELVRLRAVMLADLGTDPGDRSEHWRQSARAWFAERIAGRPDWICVVAGSGPGEPLLATGMAWETYHLPGPERVDGRRGYIDGMVTDRPARGQGHAHRIVDALVLWLNSRGIQYIQLHASPSGVPVYTAAGFTQARYPAMDLITGP